jgi:tRNA (cmo5U34)-methyltransferase
MVLSDLPADARILCIGVGTGKELIDLAQVFPQWRFTAVEPAAPMLDICRQRAEECGIAASRCTFHEGFLDSLPESDSFDAATCILVSHFITQIEERRNLFRQIAARLRPGGYLVNADIASDMSASAHQSLFEIWMQALKYSEMPAEQVEKFRVSFGQDVALAVKQPGTDVVFQRLDVAGQGGLADIQCLRSPGKIPLLSEHDRVS